MDSQAEDHLFGLSYHDGQYDHTGRALATCWEVIGCFGTINFKIF